MREEYLLYHLEIIIDCEYFKAWIWGGDMEQVCQQLHLQAFLRPVWANIKLFHHSVSYL